MSTPKLVGLQSCGEHEGQFLMQPLIIPAAGSSTPFNPLPISAKQTDQTDLTNDEEELIHPWSVASGPRVPPGNRRRHLYRGHRSGSLIVEDLDELTEWRARQRTFDGAYLRTALGSSFFALTITKMFRKDMSKNTHFPQPTPLQPHDAAPPRIWGREYRTPGDAVLVMAAAAAAIQIHLIVLFSSLD
ncbi:uncharacterized protein VP01_1075g7 [Puccinia sorghi]|uniref:Uncharacterized protein n=1 Tax=Puccinia sorghi TaxID=27349 RepID=A0A0L6VTI5_9BASI|nr:uncharacterized protein VP01_1075g7 [Puccinia sorghi]